MYEDLKFGVISDLHISSKMETGADTHTVTMLEYFKKQNVDAVLITGDVATTGLEEEYQKFNDIWDSVFTDPAAAPEKIVMTGNHEFEQAYYGRETVEDVYRKYMEAYGYDSINRNVVVGGYHFITLTSESAAVDGQYTQVTTDWLKEQLDAAGRGKSLSADFCFGASIAAEHNLRQHLGRNQDPGAVRPAQELSAGSLFRGTFPLSHRK